MKQYVCTNPLEVVEIGFDNLKNKIRAGKCEVESDIAAFIYYPCLAVKERRASYADITAAFNYRGFTCKDGILTFKSERLFKFFEVTSSDEETIFLRFNASYKESDEELVKRVLVWEALFNT